MSKPHLRRPALTAAARRYTVQIAGTSAATTGGGWQAAAVNAYRTTPEIRYVARWVGSAMSGARLFAGTLGPDNSIIPLPEDHPAVELVSEIAGGPSGQPDFLAAFGPHLCVTGESWIVVLPVLDKNTQAVKRYEWKVIAPSEVQVDGRRMTVTLDGIPRSIPPYDEEQPDDTAPIAIRVWTQDPFLRNDSDSSVKSSLELLDELQLLTAAIRAVAQSRLTGRGVLLVPKGTRFPTPGGPVDGVDDDLIDVFMNVASTAIQDPASAAATVPIVLEVPSDVIGEVKWLTFDSEFDSMAQKLREELLRRVAIGMDVPPEIVQGMSSLSHWTAWSVMGDALRTAVEPKLATVCHALTSMWVRPLLDARGVEDSEDVLVWYDTSSLRTATNKAAVAIEAFKEGLISAKAARRETGFTEADAPGAEDAEEAEDLGESTEDVTPIEQTGPPPADTTGPQAPVQEDA